MLCIESKCAISFWSVTSETLNSLVFITSSTVLVESAATRSFRETTPAAAAFIECICVVYGFDVAQLLPQISYRFVNGRIWTESGKPRIHQIAGDILAIGEKRARVLPGHVVQKLQKILPITSGRFLNQIGGIVRRQQAYVQPAHSFRECEHKFRLRLGVQIQKENCPSIGAGAFQTCRLARSCEGKAIGPGARRLRSGFVESCDFSFAPSEPCVMASLTEWPRSQQCRRIPKR